MIPNIKKDAWLSEIIRKEVYNFIVDQNSLAQIEKLHSRWLDKFQESEIFIYSKIPTNYISCVQFLERSGYNLVDTNIKLNKLPGLQKNLKLSNNSKLRLTKPSDKEQVVNIAKNNFKYSRFHTDPLIDNSIANTIKGKWAENYYHGKRGDTMIVAQVEDKIAGFLLLIRNYQRLIIDLIAVDAKHQGQKIASDMILYAESFIEHSEFIVGTQVLNIPSIRLYEKIGFRMFAAQYVYHYHNFLREKK